MAPESPVKAGISATYALKVALAWPLKHSPRERRASRAGLGTRDLSQMKTIFAAAAFLALGLAGTAAAADAKGNYSVVGLGAHTCADYVSAPKEVGQIVGIWVQGYATAMNQMLPDVKDVTGGRTDAQIEQALVGVCNQNPNMLLADATREMVVKMAGLEGKAKKKTAKADPAPAAEEGVPALRR